MHANPRINPLAALDALRARQTPLRWSLQRYWRIRYYERIIDALFMR